ncbi:MAG: 3-phosphoshikimate 1-carboxyvinyltransferase [Peptococcaceae bacterium]|nr:3-phosphoshikimate 1-carboxyvinyltransferase [Peptococcaceae bacterium]
MKLSPARLSGTVAAIPSKSAAHRLFIAASLADRASSWTLPSSSVDIDTTLACMAALGADVQRDGARVGITPIRTAASQATIDCQESGSTLRFLLPVAAALGGRYDFLGRGRLPERPIADFLEVIEGLGARTTAHKLPLSIAGPLHGGTAALPGHVSSQYLTGLLLAAPLLDGALDIQLTTPLQSRPYIDLTLDVLRQFGIDVTTSDDHFHVDANARYQLPDRALAIEGDWSNACFFLAAGAISAPVTVTGLRLDSCQGDKAVLDILRRFGAEVRITAGGITVAPGDLTAQEISMKEIPDALPILAVVAAQAQGTTVFTDIERLRLKESDRIATTSALLEAMGVHTESDTSTMRVTGAPTLCGGATVDSAGDHRIAMAAAIAALNADAPITLTGAAAVSKSYPHFFEDYASLGGDTLGI